MRVSSTTVWPAVCLVTLAVNANDGLSTANAMQHSRDEVKILAEWFTRIEQRIKCLEDKLRSHEDRLPPRPISAGHQSANSKEDDVLATILRTTGLLQEQVRQLCKRITSVVQKLEEAIEDEIEVEPPPAPVVDPQARDVVNRIWLVYSAAEENENGRSADADVADGANDASSDEDDGDSSRGSDDTSPDTEGTNDLLQVLVALGTLQQQVSELSLSASCLERHLLTVERDMVLRRNRSEEEAKSGVHDNAAEPDAAPPEDGSASAEEAADEPGEDVRGPDYRMSPVFSRTVWNELSREVARRLLSQSVDPSAIDGKRTELPAPHDDPVSSAQMDSLLDAVAEAETKAQRDLSGTIIQISLSVALLIFGALLLVMQHLLIRKQVGEWDSTAILRLNIIPLVIFAGLFLIVAGYSEMQIASMMGLLGTIAGYLLGKDVRTQNAGPPTQPSATAN